MSAEPRTVVNVLMTSANDTGVGGVQVVFRNLVRWLEGNDRRVHLLYPAPLPRILLAKKLNAWGHEASYCAMPAIVKDSVVVSIPVLLLYLPVVVFQLSYFVWRKRIDVINCHYLDPYFIHLVIVGRLLNVPVVVSVHGADVDAVAAATWLNRLLLWLIVRGAYRVVACSHALAKQSAEVFPVAQGKVTWVHNGLDLSEYQYVEGTSRVSSPVLLCVCRHVRKKGVDTLIRTFALLAAEMPQLSLVLVGDGPLLSEHQALVTRLRLDGRVMFVGEVPHCEVSSFFADCTVFVLPSRAEPFGLVLLEAAYYRKPIVCTRVGGVPELFTHEISGLLVEPDDPAAMATQIRRLLNSEALARELGEAAHQKLMTNFQWRDRIKDYIAVFEGRSDGRMQQGWSECPQAVAERPVRPTTPNRSRAGRFVWFPRSQWMRITVAARYIARSIRWPM